MASSMAGQVPQIHRQDLESAISKAVELRALHAALLHNTNTNPNSMRLQPPGASPSFTRLSTHLSSEDYPVFTPSYEEEPPPYRLCRSEAWNGGSTTLEEGEEEDLESLVQRLTTTATRHNHKSPSIQHHNLNQKMPISEDQRSTNSSHLNHITLLHSSPISITRADSEDLRSIVARSRNSLSNRKPSNNNNNNNNTSSYSSNRASIISWLLPRTFKKKPKSDTSPRNHLEYWDVEGLKKEVLLANENRDVALAQAGEMRASMEELREKLQHLEAYCQDLKKALKHSALAKSPMRSSLMPVTDEAMVEGFLQMVSESRLSVKQFCRSLATHVQDMGSEELLDNLLLPNNSSSSSSSAKATSSRTAKTTRLVLYQLEALVNQTLHQDFENCVFRRDGSPRELDPGRERRANFASFVALRNLRWSEVVRKGTRCYSEEFSGFCDRKMGAVAGVLGWGGRWPEELLHGFFVAAKCMWLLHLLAFSFEPPLGILRVEEGRAFDGGYMEDVMMGGGGQRGKPQHQHHQQARVKVMVVPGFYVEDRVLKCRVLCRYRNAS